MVQVSRRWEWQWGIIVYIVILYLLYMFCISFMLILIHSIVSHRKHGKEFKHRYDFGYKDNFEQVWVWVGVSIDMVLS